MHNLIQALLTYSRVGRRELTFVNVSLEKLVNKVIKRYEPDLEQRDIEWQIGPLDVVYADPYMVEIVFDNLIANAIKFSSHQETARIEISSQPRNGLVDIQVKDNGVGFDMAYADRLFGVFQRLHNDDEFPGTGIGLAIVKRIVQDHNGQVRAQAEPGQGAVFTVSLPKGGEKR
jgi:light-regulated signal transduction histidine kinase (bacteriophytochrome)